MAAEHIDFTNEQGYKKTLSIHDTDISTRKLIVMPEGPRVYREQLEAHLGNHVIKDVFLYRPDTEEVPYESEIPTVKMGGLWTIGNHYAKEAIAMAQHGHDFATFIPNFKYSPLRPLYDKQLRKSPYVWHSKNGRQVSKAVIQHTGIDKVQISGHSYAGHTTTELMAHSPELIESVVLQDPAGIGMHDVNFGELWNEELKPAMQILGEDLQLLSPNTKTESILRVAGNAPHAVRELLGLAYLRADFRVNLNYARERGIPVGLLLLSQSAIFNAAENRRISEEENLFDMIDEVDEYHIAPNIRPSEVVETEIEMFKQLNSLRKPVRRPTSKASKRRQKS